MPTKADGVTVNSTWTANMVSGKAKNEVQVLDNGTKPVQRTTNLRNYRRGRFLLVVDSTNVVHASTVHEKLNTSPSTF